MIEKLEFRRLLDAELSQNTLIIRGLDDPFGGDDINITFSKGKLLLVMSPEGFRQQYTLSQVRRFNIETFRGNDRVRIDPLITRAATINGGEGDDVLIGGSGDDSINGGEGNDFLDGGFDRGLSSDILIGGLGVDAVNYATRNLPMNITLDGVANDGSAGENDNVDSTVEIVIGGGAADSITSALSVPVTLYGNGGDDTLISGVGADRLVGGPGDDVMNSGDGDDTLVPGTGTDTMIAGLGNDTVTYYYSNQNLLLSLDGIGNDGGPGENDIIGADVENIFGGNGNDRIIGNDLPNRIGGGGGNDSILAQGGDDTISGGAGDDTMNGGLGNDRLDGGPGADIFIGGAGIDTATYRSHTAGVVVSIDNVANDGRPQERDNVRTDIEILEGGSGNDRLTGSDLANTILGGLGNDTIVGGAGDDQMDGGPGNDNLDGGLGNDTFLGGPGNADVANYSLRTEPLEVELDDIPGDGGLSELDNVLSDVEIVIGGSGNDLLVGFARNQRLEGRAGNDTLFGGAGNDILDGGDGNDSLDGEGNDDIMIGGNGIDTVSYAGVTTGIDVTLNNMADDGPMGESDNVMDDVEVIIGGPMDDEITGSDAAETLIGGEGNDLIDGGGGNDSIDGGGGNDTLIGGPGNDTLRGGLGDDFLRAIDLVEDLVDGGLGIDAAQTDFVDIVLNIP